MGPINRFAGEMEHLINYVFIGIDRHSRNHQLRGLGGITAHEVTETFKQRWVNKKGELETVLTYRRSQFTSETFNLILTQYSIKHSTTIAYNPTGNSIVELVNRELEKGLRVLAEMPTRDALRGI